MTLKIQTEEDDQRQLKVIVDVPEERVARAMRRKARKLARELRIPGFRPGKAPYSVIVRRVGAQNLRAEVAEEMMPEIYEEMLTELDVSVYGLPSLDDMDLEPLQLRFTLPLEATVELGDYRSIRMEMESVELADDAVDDALEYVRMNHEVIEPVDRPSALGDMLTLDGHGAYLDGEGEKQILFEEDRIEMLLDADVTFKGSTFVENLLGLEAGDEVSFELTFPDDYEDESLAGREASFELIVLDVKERDLPELDDELAKLEGDYETLDELRASLAENLMEQAERQARADFFENMAEKIRSGATVVYPPAAVDAELASRLNNMREQVTQAGWEWEDYLRLQNETEESLKEAWHDAAVERLEGDLILLHFARNEKLELDQEAIDSELDKRLESVDDEEMRGRLRQVFEEDAGQERIGNELLFDMVIDRMQAIGSGTAPDLDLEESSDDDSTEEVSEEDGEGEAGGGEAPQESTTVSQLAVEYAAVESEDTPSESDEAEAVADRDDTISSNDAIASAENTVSDEAVASVLEADSD